MKIKDGQPKFKPMNIELEDVDEIQLVDCICNFLLGLDDPKKLIDWYSTYYLNDQDFNDQDLDDIEDKLTSLLKNIEIETNKRLR